MRLLIVVLLVIPPSAAAAAVQRYPARPIPAVHGARRERGPWSQANRPPDDPVIPRCRPMDVMAPPTPPKDTTLEGTLCPSARRYRRGARTGKGAARQKPRFPT